MSVPSLFENKLQSRLFELLLTESAYTFEEFLVKLSSEIKSMINGNACSIYFLDDWKENFILYNEKDDRTLTLRTHLSFNEVMDKDRQYLLPEDDIKDLLFIEGGFRDVKVVPLKQKQRIMGFLIMEPGHDLQIGISALHGFGEVIAKGMIKAKSFYQNVEEKRKYELLYNVTSHFHSSIDMEGVLREVIETLREVHPDFQYYLLLSQDYKTVHDLPVRELIYDTDTDSDPKKQAYLTGEIQMDDNVEGGRPLLYAPLKGKQGVYGVLEVVPPHYLYFPKKDIEFFIHIAHTAGNALENAQLYQQSRKLNSDLQLINSTSQKLNSNTRLTEKISYMAYKIEQSFEADEVGFITYDDKNGYKVLEGSSDYFTSLDSGRFIHAIEEGLLNHKGPLFVSDLKTKSYGYDFPFRSLMAVPMKDHEHISGLSIVLHQDPYYFSFESFKLLQSLVQHSTLAFANSMLREELEKAVVTDYLTKLHSRIYLDQCVANHVKQDGCGHFILFDIDNFKSINDTYGHQVGDEVICQVAHLIKDSVGQAGLAARWGGEELALYLPSTDRIEAFELVNSIRQEIAANTDPAVTVSCGFASWEADRSRPTRKQIVQQADRALYQAKESGRNCIVTDPPVQLSY
ncbi:sensor domain-containing diguanylate cyclase [Halobacillus litoralis]|uniref:sensor domain-containing diguanylate cyclase n=1 Tax=Halobacillus litoralis TaxID=45668 RepID=UPI001CFC6566|nr:sensor domain-containing diguanylate cyclase [Halobacillus litoralis]